LGLILLFGLAFATTLSGALMPGPVLFATVRWSAQHGRIVGPLIVAGHAVVEVPLVLAIIFGLGSVLSAHVLVGVVGLAGGAVLLAMGGLMLKAAPRLALPQSSAEQGGDARLGAAKIVAAGAITSLSNPYFPLWWATVGLSLLARAEPFGPTGYVVLYIGHVMTDLAWYGAISESVHRGRRLLSDRSYRWLVAVCAVLLIVIAVVFAWQGWRSLRS
jgi:threonine/homoserine/homoserine lactone efflux protein